MSIKELRLKNNGITTQFNSAYECISALHGIQTQYDIYAYIALVNRVKNFEMEKLFKDENIVKSWGQRVTLHINTKENMLVNKTVFSSKNNWIKRYVKQLGGECNEIVGKIVNASYESNFFSKMDIQNNIQHKEKSRMMQWGGILAEASIEGYIYEILSNKKEKIYAKMDTDLIDRKISYEQAIETLIEKYIVSFGPVSTRDFIHWSGLRKIDVEEYWKISVKKFEQLKVGGTTYYYRRNEIEREKSNIVLLGKFDPLLLAYYDKTWLVDEKYIHRVWKSAGQIEGVLLVDNRFIGTWHCNQKNNKIYFYVRYEYNINQSTKNKVEEKTQYIAKVLKKQYGGVIIENEDIEK